MYKVMGMNNAQKKILREIIDVFAKKNNMMSIIEIESAINILASMPVDYAIDNIIVTLNDWLKLGAISLRDIFENYHLILLLNPEKYKSVDDLIKRLTHIKEMNMEHPSIPLSENHRLVIECFDKFNELINNRFDCYYVGEIMGYFATNTPLERYHGDLDLFINEEQLVQLKWLIDLSSEFSFVSNMKHKEVQSHEYKITYKDTPMSIGLFLFERNLDNSITTKEYYYEEAALFVDEHHFSKRYTDLVLSDEIRNHNEIPYKMFSLEYIYNSKKSNRSKDIHDANVIRENIDELIDYKIDVEKRNNYDIKHKPCTNSIIQTIEYMLATEKANKQSSISKKYIITRSKVEVDGN